jgi:hypothetical protein
MDLAEPMTALTDLVLSLLAFGFALRLVPYAQRLRQESIRDWGIAFAVLGVGALAGAISHGLTAYLSETVSAVVWRVTLYSIGVASVYMVSGTARAALRHRVASWLILIAGIKLLAFLYRSSVTPEFHLAVYEYIPNMIAVLVMGLVLRRYRRNSSGLWITLGVIVSFVAAGVQLNGLSPHPSFNHNDLYHVIQMVGLVLLYRGATGLQDTR